MRKLFSSWSKVIWNAVAALSLICGLVYLTFSGRAEGFTGPRTALVFPILILNAVGFSLCGWVTYSFVFKRRKKFSKNAWFAFLAVLLCDAMIGIGRNIDNKLIHETKLRGDRIQISIESFSAKNGRPPESLEELKGAGFEVPTPALKGSEFQYKLGGRLSFSSVAFMICERRDFWVCDD